MEDGHSFTLLFSCEQKACRVLTHPRPMGIRIWQHHAHVPHGNYGPRWLQNADADAKIIYKHETDGMYQTVMVIQSQFSGNVICKYNEKKV